MGRLRTLKHIWEKGQIQGNFRVILLIFVIDYIADEEVLAWDTGPRHLKFTDLFLLYYVPQSLLLLNSPHNSYIPFLTIYTFLFSSFLTLIIGGFPSHNSILILGYSIQSKLKIKRLLSSSIFFHVFFFMFSTAFQLPNFQ